MEDEPHTPAIPFLQQPPHECDGNASVPTRLDAWEALVPPEVVERIAEIVERPRETGRPAQLVLCPDRDEDGIASALILKSFLGGIGGLAVSVLVDQAKLDKKCKRMVSKFGGEREACVPLVPSRADILLVCDSDGDPMRFSEHYAVLLDGVRRDPEATVAIVMDHHRSEFFLEPAVKWDAVGVADANSLQAWGLGLALRRRLGEVDSTATARGLLGPERYAEVCRLI